MSQKSEIEKALRESSGASTSQIRAAQKALGNFSAQSLIRFQQAQQTKTSEPTSVAVISEASLQKFGLGLPKSPDFSKGVISGVVVELDFIKDGVVTVLPVLSSTGVFS